MKKTLLTFALALASVWPGKAQDCLPTAQDYERFMETKTLVVMDANTMSDFNFKIKEVMKRVWNLTKYDFITEKEFDIKKNDPSYSFLLTTTVTFDADKTKARYIYLSLLMGKEKTKVKDLPDLISIPLAYASVEDQKYAYKMDAFVRFIQEHVNLMRSNPKLISKNPLLYYNKNMQSLSNKTLWLIKEDLQSSMRTEAAVKKVYPYRFRFATEEEVSEAIERRDPDVAFLHKVGPEVSRYKTRCYKIIVGAADTEFFYFDYHTIDKSTPDKLLERDLKKMGKR